MRWLYPRKLYHQIAVLISVVIVAAFFTFGSLTAKKQAEFLKNIMTENAMRMTQALSESCIRYLLISDYAGLDELLKKFIIMSDSLQIQVYRDDGKVLSEVSKESATSSPVRSVGKITTQVPEGATKQIVVSNGRMIIWQPIVSIKVIGWVRIAYSLKNINDMHQEIWIATGKAAVFWTLLSITLFMFVFNPLARAIRGLSDFARQLGSHKGEQIDIRHSSYEIQQLCQALNYASVDLCTKEKEVTLYRGHLEEMVAKRTVELQKEIFERRKVEAVLKESEERLRTLINSTPDIVCFKDGEGRWLEANEADLELFQLNGVDYRGKKDSELAGFSDFYREAFLSCEATDEKAWQAQAPTRGDETIPRPDGTAKVLDVIKVPLFHKDKKRKGLVVLGRDITERKKAEASLQESEKRYRSMMEAMKDSVYICSSGFRIEYMNPKMVSWIGRNAVGDYCYKTIYNSDKKCSWCVLDNILQGEHIDYELANPIDNRYYSVTNSPVYHSGKVISKLTMFRDITDKKSIEAQLRQARKMESIGPIAGGIAHDFNNILYMIVGNVELAMEDIPEWNPIHENLKEIKSAGLRAADIVRQLLNFSRQTDQELKPIGAVMVIKDALKFLRSTMPASIEIQQKFPDKEVAILGDPTQIHQVMMNLCINTSQAMEETGGVLNILVETITLNDRANDCNPDLTPGDWLKITVRDSGPGIRPDIIDRIFDPYFTTKDVGKGSGMGLAVVHGIVKNHHGIISVDSKSGQGATFTIFFPVVTERPAVDIKSSDVIPRGAGERVLFVDDEASITDMVGKMLERLGYKMQTTISPVDALQLFRSEPDAFDLVLTDMTMPQMTGVKLSEKLKEIRTDIPVIICTGHSSIIDEERAISIGIDGYVMKPIGMRDIAKAIRNVLDKAKGCG